MATAAITKTIPDVYRLTYEDWLRMPEDVGRLYEILGGELYVSPTPTTRHQMIVSALLFFLYGQVQTTGRGVVLTAPMGVKLSDEDVPEPDLLVVLSEHAHRLEEPCVAGPPDLVVEVLSPGTAGRDVGIKRELYESAGVPEYWIVDPIAGKVHVLALASGRYRTAGSFARGETLTSPSLPGLAIPLAEVFPAS